MVTKINSEPILQSEDTLTSNGLFYKNKTNMYWLNGDEESFLADTLLIQINHIQKTIWISRVNRSEKEKLNAMDIPNKQFQQLIRRNFSMQKTTVNIEVNRLSFIAKQLTARNAVMSSLISLDYNINKQIPIKIEMDIRLQQPLSDEMVADFRTRGTNESKLIGNIDGKNYLMRRQVMTMKFSDISNSEEKARRMPSWNNVLDYHTEDQLFTAKEKYADYEITKTF
jgi:hypothetical protein